MHTSEDVSEPVFVRYAHEKVVGTSLVRAFNPVSVLHARQQGGYRFEDFCLAASEVSIQPDDQGRNRIAALTTATDMHALMEHGRVRSEIGDVFKEGDLDLVDGLNRRLFSGLFSSGDRPLVSGPPENIMELVYSGSEYPRYNVLFDSHGEVVSAKRIAPIESE